MKYRDVLLNSSIPVKKDGCEPHLKQTKGPADIRLSSEPMYMPIVDAISQKQSIKIRYGDDDKPRHFDPYVFYQHKGTGNYLIHGLQTLDPNKPDFQPKPRTFKLAEIQSVEMSDRHFEPETNFDADQMKEVEGIIAIIATKTSI